MTFTEPPLKAVKESYAKFLLLYTPREEILVAHALSTISMHPWAEVS
jgi:hypothetical protein